MMLANSISSLDKFNVSENTAYVIKSPVECKRSIDSFKDALNGSIIIDGINYTIIGIDVHSISSPIHIGESIVVLVKTINKTIEFE